MGFSTAALVRGQNFSHLVEQGAAELEKPITADIYQSSAILLTVASSVIVIISFFGCCGAYKVLKSIFLKNVLDKINSSN